MLQEVELLCEWSPEGDRLFLFLSGDHPFFCFLIGDRRFMIGDCLVLLGDRLSFYFTVFCLSFWKIDRLCIKLPVRRNFITYI